jgi:hypothetical protein
MCEYGGNQGYTFCSSAPRTCACGGGSSMPSELSQLIKAVGELGAAVARLCDLLENRQEKES